VNACAQFLAQLAREDAVLVTVVSSRGSVPRDAGAWMAVFARSLVGTVGGGHLENDALRHARALLVTAAADATQASGHTIRYALGPSLGQCCGGEVHLSYRRVSGRDSAALHLQLTPARVPVALFGGGHVGRALATVLGTLPFAVRWVDSRDEIFPEHLPDNVQCEHSDPVQAAVAEMAAQSRVLVMSFSHAEDLEVVAACLQRQRTRGDLPYIGLIGSKTKWAAFRNRLQARGFTDTELAHVTSPIGVPGIHDKRPEVIAVAVAAQLLQLGFPSAARD
jgi:xanthine dehydrogenase accessory factor